jgi:hypothetical protein
MANGTSIHIETARGYLALGMVQEADDELEKLGARASSRADVMRMKAVVCER